MLGEVLTLLENPSGPSPARKLPTVQVDRGGGGGGPRAVMYDVADYLQAAGSFRELPDEHPVTRAARRAEHIARELVRIKAAREGQEKAMAVGMLWGARLERMAATAAEIERAPVAVATPVAPVVERESRGQSSVFGALAAGFVVGVAVAVVLSRTPQKRNGRRLS